MKTVIAAALATLSVIFTAVFSIGMGVKAAEVSVPPKDFTVVIDAGHGGIDAGVLGVNTKVKESDLNLAIAGELKKYFEAAGISVVLTRETSAGLYGLLSKGFKMRDMEKRKEIINGAGADVMISVHLNYFDMPSRRGGQVFYKEGSEEGRKLAESIQNEFNCREEQPKDFEPLCGDYYVLNESECVAVLCECGFLSNDEDERLLVTEEYRKEVAYAIYKGTISYFVA